MSGVRGASGVIRENKSSSSSVVRSRSVVEPAAADAVAPSPVLAVPTPAAWFEAAPRHRDVLLVDHANCEKKAASTALALMFSYADDGPLGLALSRLAREELRHYEQVVRLMRDLRVAYGRLAPSRYAAGLRRAIRGTEPVRKLDLMLCGALIEARSCERFHGLVPRLEPRIAEFYRGLEAAESRHQGLYLDLARRHAREHGLDADARLAELAAVEADLVTTPDREFRFHSGPP